MDTYRSIQLTGQTVDDTQELMMLLEWSGVSDLTGKDVLEVGSNNGIMLQLIRMLNPKSVVGYDINPRYINEELNVKEGWQESLPVKDNSIDLYISSETLEHSYDHKLAIKEMYRVLRPNGLALIGVPWGFKHSAEPIHHSAVALGLTKKNTSFLKKQFEHKDLKSIKTSFYKHNEGFTELRILVTKK